MIMSLIVTILIGVVKLLLFPLPDLPDTPSAVIDGGDWIIDSITSVISVLTMVFTTQLVAASVVVIVAILTFDYAYNGIMWVLKKIPILDIH